MAKAKRARRCLLRRIVRGRRASKIAELKRWRDFLKKEVEFMKTRARASGKECYFKWVDEYRAAISKLDRQIAKIMGKRSMEEG